MTPQIDFWKAAAAVTFCAAVVLGLAAGQGL